MILKPFCIRLITLKLEEINEIINWYENTGHTLTLSNDIDLTPSIINSGIFKYFYFPSIEGYSLWIFKIHNKLEYKQYAEISYKEFNEITKSYLTIPQK